MPDSVHTPHTLARWPNRHASLLICLINNLHLPYGLFPTHPSPGPLSPFDPVHKRLQHVTICSPPVLALALALWPRIRLFSLCVLLRLDDRAALRAICSRSVDINFMPDMGSHEILQRDCFLRRYVHVVFNAMFLAQCDATRGR
jgi:hypothetical protein